MMRNMFYTVSALLTGLLYSPLVMAQDAGVDAEQINSVAHHAEHAGEKASGLPQLDPTYFASQLFWLAISGLVLYVVMARLALPRIAQLKEERDHFVQDNLKQAAALRSQAETAKVNYDLALRDAESKAKTVITKAIEQARQTYDNALNEAADKIQKDVDQAEARLHDQKNTIMQTIDQQAAALATEILQKTFEAKMGRAA
jgi:F-type H+-transporting ATPase subunit b